MAGKNEVDLSAKVNLAKILETFRNLGGENKKLGAAFKTSANDVGESINSMTKNTEKYLGQVGNFARRIGDQIKDDFKALLSINAVKESLKISEQFRGSVTEALDLNDTIRKLGRTFGLTSGDFARFQKDMVRGLGDIGLSSEVATKTLEGLAETPVRARGALIEYAKVSGQLASVSKTKGSEGEIAQGMARVLEARGVNPNDVGSMKSVAEDLRRVFNQTGKGPKATLSTMEELFSGMSKDFRAKMSTRGLANLAAVAQVSGPNSTKFLEEFLGKSPIARKAMEAQGFGGVVGEKGLDVEKFKRAADSILSRVGGDPRMAAQTLGLSEEAAEGFVRLTEKLGEAQKAQEAINSSTGNLNEQYDSSLGALEGFKASINKVKGLLAGPMATATEKVSEAMAKLSKSNIGAIGTVLGGGVFAALLAGGGLRGIGRGVMGVGKEKLTEAITGKEVIPVRVVNASEIGMGIGGAMAQGKIGAMMEKAGALIGAGTVGYAAGSLINDKLIEPMTQGTTQEGFQGNVVERLFFKLDKLIGGEKSSSIMRSQKVIVEMNDPRLKHSTQPTRGASN